MEQRYTLEMHFYSTTKLLILALAGGLFSLSTSAQWQWVDKDGRRVYSDRSPPADILEKDIVKRPGAVLRPSTAASADVAAPPVNTASAPAAKLGSPKITGKDPQLEARKKQAEDEEAAKKKIEEGKALLARADNCERAKKGQVSFQSGVRIAVVNAKGEREIMDESARASENRRLQAIVDSDCK